MQAGPITKALINYVIIGEKDEQVITVNIEAQYESAKLNCGNGIHTVPNASL
jgi:hypothetical protein